MIKTFIANLQKIRSCFFQHHVRPVSSMWARQSLLALFILAGVVLVPFGYHGVLGPAFPPDETCELFEIEQDLKTTPLLTVMQDRLRKDLKLRCRPLYFVGSVTQTKLIGTNHPLLHLLGALYLIATSWFVFLLLRQLRHDSIESCCGAILAIAGPQISIGLRTCLSERLGYLWLCSGLFFLVRAASRNRFGWSALLGMILMSMAALQKESFLLCVPAALLMFWHEWCCWAAGSGKRRLGALIGVSAYLALLFVGLLLIIKFVVGTGNLGYAGVDQTSLRASTHIAHLFWETGRGSLLVLLLINVALVWLLNSLRRHAWRDNLVKICHSLALPLLVALALLLPQCYLYAKSGLFAHYYVPGLLAFAILVPALMRAARLTYRQATGTKTFVFAGACALVVARLTVGGAYAGIRTEMLLSGPFLGISQIMFTRLAIALFIIMALVSCEIKDGTRTVARQRDYSLKMVGVFGVVGVLLTANLVKMERGIRGFVNWSAPFYEAVSLVERTTTTSSPILCVGDPYAHFNSMHCLYAYLVLRDRPALFQRSLLQEGRVAAGQKLVVQQMYLRRAAKQNSIFKQRIGYGDTDEEVSGDIFDAIFIMQSAGFDVEKALVASNKPDIAWGNYLRVPFGNYIVYVRSRIKEP